MLTPLPSLIGVVHLLPLPTSPRYAGSLDAIITRAVTEAQVLTRAGFDAIMIENFGDAPFVPDRVSPVTVAAMTACARAIRVELPSVVLGINVLRNDAEAALAVAVASGASMIRINVHTGARVTDQGLIQGRAHETLRLRHQLGADTVQLLCDVDVKHSAPLAKRSLSEECEDLTLRGLADAVLVTGTGTGRAVVQHDLEQVLEVVRVPVFVASGVTEQTLRDVSAAHGVLVGSCIRKEGRAGQPLEPDATQTFADAFWRIRKSVG